MTSFSMKIQELPALTLCGLSILTNMEKAAVDCSSLWEKDFGPRIPELCSVPCGSAHGASYGVSIMDVPEQGSFHYWAAMPIKPGTAPLSGMSLLELPAGLFATCPVPSLAVLGDAFTYAYMQWPQSQSEYGVAFDRPCLEKYGPEFLANGCLDIFVPVYKK